MSDPLSAALDRLQDEQNAALGASAVQAYNVNPDQQARRVALAQRTGVPVHAVPEMEDEARLQDLAQTLRALPRTHPVTAQLLANPERAKVAHDDLPSLTGVEDLARYGFPQSPGTSTLSIDGTKRPTMLPSALDSNELVTKPLKSLVGSSTKTLARVASLIPMPAEAGPAAEEDYLKQLAGVYDWAENLRKEGEPSADLGFGGRLFRSFVGLAPFLVAGPAGVGLLVGNAYNDRRDELLAQGVQPDVANLVAGISGLGAYSFTKIPFGGGSAISSVIRGATLNPAAGALERAVQRSALAGFGYEEEAQRTPIMTPQDLALEIAMGAFFGAQHAAQAGKPLRGETLAETVVPFYDAVKAARRAQALQAAGEVVKGSKLDGRDPQAMAEQLRESFGAQGVTHLFVPVERWAELYQNRGLDPAQVARESLSDPTAYEEAQRTRSHVVVPVEDFVGRLSKVDGYDELVRESSPALGESSLREAEELAQRAQQETDAGGGFLKAFSDMVLRADSTLRARQGYQQVRDNLAGQLEAAGVPPDVAAENAHLVANAFRVLGERTGTAPEELFSQYPVRVGRETEKENPNAIPAADRPFIPAPSDLAVGGGGAGTVLRAGGTDEVVGRQESVNPEWWLKLTENERPKTLTDARAVLARAARGEPLTEKERAFVYAGIEANRERAASMPPTEIQAADLKVGDTFERGGEKFRVTSENADGTVTIQDGKTEHLDPWDTVEADAGTFTGTLFQADHFLSGAAGEVARQELETLYAGEGERLGKIQFDPKNLRAGFDITLLKSADLSTFLHETGHYFANVLGDLAGRPDAPQQVRDDFQTLLKFVGAESREGLTTEHQETLARAFERYLMEGQAPSAEAHGLFQRLKWWLVSVYKDLKALRVDLTDEVRGVFDRLVATDEEISRTRQNEGMTALFLTPEAAGMTPREFDLYRGAVEKASEDAKETLFRRLVDEKRREQEKWWKDESAKVRAQVEAEARQDPAYTAYHAITTGKDWEGNPVGDIRLSREALVARYGEEGVKALPRSFQRLYAKEGGLHPDLVAETFGLGSGDELVQRILEQPKFREHVAAETQRRMEAQFGDLLKNPAQMADAAREAVENDAQGRVLRAEAEALHRLQRTVKPFVAAEKENTRQAERDAGATARWYDAERKTAEANRQQEARDVLGAVPPLSTFRQIARDTMDEKRVAEIRPDLYALARQKAGREAFEAAAKGDYQGAFDAKMRELLNFHLEKEARAAVEFEGTVQAYASKMATTKQLGKIGLAGQEFLEQIRGILDRYSFARITKEEADRQETLRQFVERLRDPDGQYMVDLPIPDEVLNTTRTVNYRNLSLGELRAVYDSMRMIQRAAYLVNTTAAEGQRIARAEAQTRLAFAVGTNTGGAGSRELVTDDARSWLDRMKDATPDIALLRPEFLFERFDGGKQGPWHELVWDRYNDAADFQNRLRAELFPTIMEYARGAKIDRSQKYLIKSIGATLTKDDIISIALNCGNESNLTKLMEGGLGFKGREPVALDSSALQEILGHLSASEIGVVNGIWRTIEKLKPYAAELARKRLGVEPEWIEAKPMQIANGTLEGGYYPVKYDPRFSKAGEKQTDASTLDQMFRRYAGSTTRQGYMKERSQFSAPLSLDWQAVVSRHLDEVITDVSHWEFATDTQRLLKSKTVKDTLIGTLGESYYKNLLDWVRYTVNQDTMGREASDNFERRRRQIRSNMSTYLLGFRVLNSVAEMGITPALAFQQVKNPGSVVTGIMTYLRNPMEATRFANEASDWHKELQYEFGRDITQAMADLAGKNTVLDDVKRWSIECRQAFWKIGATMAWHIGYADALAQGLEGKAAVRVADSIYRMTQEGGRAGDLSAIERNPNMRELTMFVGPQLIQYNNFARAGRALLDRGVNADTVKLGLTTFLAGHVANALLFELMRGRYPDDPDKIPAWILARLTFGLFDGIPIVREGAKYAETKFLHEPVQDVKPLPVLQAAKEVADTVLDTGKALEGEDKWGSVGGHAARIVGYATGLPMLQATTTGKFLYDVLEGNYEPAHLWSPATDLFNYRRPKR